MRRRGEWGAEVHPLAWGMSLPTTFAMTSLGEPGEAVDGGDKGALGPKIARRTRGSRSSCRSFRQDRGTVGASSGTNPKGWGPRNLKSRLAGRRPWTLSYRRDTCERGFRS